MKIIKKEDLNLPPAPAQAPQIDWGEDFKAWDMEQQNRYLKRLCSALNHATDNIQKERNKALEDCHEMSNLVQNADKAVQIQKAIVKQALTNFNQEKQDLIQRLQELEVENKSLTTRLRKYED